MLPVLEGPPRGWLQEETAPGAALALYYFCCPKRSLLARCPEMGVLTQAPDLRLRRMPSVNTTSPRAVGP